MDKLFSRAIKALTPSRNKHRWIKRALITLCSVVLLAIIGSAVVTLAVKANADGKIYEVSDDAPHNRVGLLLGTSPRNRFDKPNKFYTERISTAASLYHDGKIDYILASGDNHTRLYDEPTAMRDSLIARGVPADRIVLDYAGFRTLDSVVRAKEIFGCDSLTIISQEDHCLRALFIARCKGVEAIAVEAPLKVNRRSRLKFLFREWLARDKMILDMIIGRSPRFLGEKESIPG